MKTAVILDVDNLYEQEIELALTLYSQTTTFFAVGLAPLDFQYKRGNSPLHCNKNKFSRLGDKFEYVKHQLVLKPNNVCMAESSDIRIAQLMGRDIMGKFDQCVVVSNDHSMFMMGIVLQQVMPTWIMITRPNHGVTMRDTNSRLNGVPVIRAKNLNFKRVDLNKFVKEH